MRNGDRKKLLASFMRGMLDIRMPMFYKNSNIQLIIGNGNVESPNSQIKKDYRKSLTGIRKVAKEFEKQQ